MWGALLAFQGHLRTVSRGGASVVPPACTSIRDKATGYVQGIFVFTYFVFGYSWWYFYVMIVFSILASVEKLVILLDRGELESNTARPSTGSFGSRPSRVEPRGSATHRNKVCSKAYYERISHARHQVDDIVVVEEHGREAHHEEEEQPRPSEAAPKRTA